MRAAIRFAAVSASIPLGLSLALASPGAAEPKGLTLSTFLLFALCGGQQQVSKIGYARLPENLVKGGLLQVANIPGHTHVPAKCPAALRS